MPAFRIIDSTLREGEQFAHARFRPDDKVAIARALDQFGVDYIELTSPAASPQSRRDAERIVGLKLSARIMAHARCLVPEVDAAIDVGAHGIGLFFATSPILRAASHRRSTQQIIDAMGPPIERALSAGLETRFSAEDAFRTDEEDLLRVLSTAATMGVHRVGLADTVGIATPREVRCRVGLVRDSVPCDIGFHGHNDTGCAVANAFEAVEAGATHVDVSVLGIGERVGITPLGGFMARMLSVNNVAALKRYRPEQLAPLERLVADVTGIGIPFNNFITGETAYSHKAGTHLKAMLEDTQSYEVISPDLFGLRRTLILGSRLTGKHAVAHRGRVLGLDLEPGEVEQKTARIKELAIQHDLTEEEVDQLLRNRDAF